MGLYLTVYNKKFLKGNSFLMREDKKLLHGVESTRLVDFNIMSSSSLKN